ncbi:hypothetical protein [Gelidibacter japonicus]|uniref:hypothetical protein n=1 Tax=Gelidibacter japonicus TaxID=1962232 RepID=UPI002AFE0F66|nr:hypothetical protein [Gelidibacter japonicus]
MTPHTINTKEIFQDNLLHIQAQDQPNTPINVKAVLKPYAAHGFRILRYVTNSDTGSMEAILKR